MANGNNNNIRQQSGGQQPQLYLMVNNTEVVVPESQILATKQYVNDNIAQLNGFKNYIINGNRIVAQSGKKYLNKY